MTYDVTAEREGRWWVFTIPVIDMVGQARSLAEVETEAKNIISMHLEMEAGTPGPEVDPANVNVHVTAAAPEEAIAQWREAEREETEANAARSHAASVRRAVVRELRDQKYTADDVGRMLGVSRQRVNQLEKA